MASHHHHCHPTTTCCCCSPSHHAPPPDPLIQCQCQSIPSDLPHPAPPQLHLSSPYYLNPRNPQTQYYSLQTHRQKHHLQTHRHHRQQLEEEQTHPIISSLLRRISVLESSMRHHSSAPFSLRDAAARTIQTHFRAFLVRRSQTLRQLKDLAFIKSVLNTLKSNLSNNTHFDSQVLSHKAMDLLIKLDSIQGGDPMIRDVKKSISRELVRFLEYLDEKRHELSTRAVKNVRFSGNSTKSRGFHANQKMSTADCSGLKGDERELLEKLRKRVEKIEGFSRVSEEEDVELENPQASINGKSGFTQNRNGILMKRHGGVQAKAKKNVSFAETGNVYMVYRSSNGQVSIGECNSNEGSDSIDADVELFDNLGREVEEIGVSSKETDEEAHTEDGESPQSSDDDRDLRTNQIPENDNEMRMHDLIQNEDGSFVFSAPLPVKMEPRADLMHKKKTVKIKN